MAPNPATAPNLFDRALLAARLSRARRAGAATFLLERVTADMADRLQAVSRSFSAAADLWTPGDGLGDALRGRVGSVDPIGFSEAEALGQPPESLAINVTPQAFHYVKHMPGVRAPIRRARN
ncbi:MAG: SAM-dependent methyltransferase, partial [Bradyrhizobium sp.]